MDREPDFDPSIDSGGLQPLPDTPDNDNNPPPPPTDGGEKQAA